MKRRHKITSFVGSDRSRRIRFPSASIDGNVKNVDEDQKPQTNRYTTCMRERKKKETAKKLISPTIDREMYSTRDFKLRAANYSYTKRHPQWFHKITDWINPQQIIITPSIYDPIYENNASTSEDAISCCSVATSISSGGVARRHHFRGDFFWCGVKAVWVTSPITILRRACSRTRCHKITT